MSLTNLPPVEPKKDKSLRDLHRESFLADKFINELHSYEDLDGGIILVGGAVLDIMEGRTPKDYDLIDFSDTLKEVLIELGYTYRYDTTTSTTFEKEGTIVQILKTSISHFDYTISQISLFLCDLELDCDEVSYNSKILIPTDHALENKYGAFASLHRRIHWEVKGYTLPNETYSSLLNVASRGSKIATKS